MFLEMDGLMIWLVIGHMILDFSIRYILYYIGL